jgi:hypothetical protein
MLSNPDLPKKTEEEPCSLVRKAVDFSLKRDNIYPMIIHFEHLFALFLVFGFALICFDNLDD